MQNGRSGEYLENARITVEGTSLQTFTETDGTYRFASVPAGVARVTVFYTSLAAQTQSVTVTAGQTVQYNVTLGAEAKADGTIVKLDTFKVETTREMEAAALAINEQRFASNMKNVVSTEEFGNVAEGNPAEFLKFMPGISIDYTGGNARDISINGVPSDYVPVTVDGFNVAQATANLNTNRAVQSDMISINNLSRIEVVKSPTPESPGSALAGSVNMVPRSAFERARPVLNASTYLLWRDNARDFNKVPGPKPSPTRNVHPGFDFSYVAPVNKSFGYTLSGGISTNFSPQDNAQTTWRGANTATNGAAFPNTTPDRPYLSQYLIQDAPKVTTRRSIGASIDYKLTPNDRFTLGFQYSSFDGRFIVGNVTFNVGRVAATDFTPFSTHGAVGAGTLQSNHQERNRFNRTYMPTAIWRHDGPVYKMDLGLGLSQQSDYNRDLDQGFFRIVNMQRTNVTINFDDIFYLRPRTITVRDGTTGALIDPFALSTYSVVSANTQANKTYDRQRTAFSSVRRDFLAPVPFTLKAGVDFREAVREMRGGNTLWNHLGADGRANTADETPLPFFDAIYSQRTLPYGFPQLQTPSNRKVWEDYVAHPNYYSADDNTTYRNKVTNSKHSDELVSSAYIRGDVGFLQGKLKLIGGVRVEQTNVKASGPLTDPTRNYQRNAAGQFIDSNPNLAGIQPTLIVPTSNALGVSQLTFIDRGAHAEKEYLRYFPSLNASYNLRENLIVRAAYYQSVGRPDLGQYSGGITLPDTGLPGSPTTNRIVVNNAAIKAWDAHTITVRLERYFEGVGEFSVGAFRRHIKNFFGATVFDATPEFLALYNLDPQTYDQYYVSTQENIETGVRMEGVDFNYRQALTFLPHWGRGVQVFANATSLRLLGDEDSNFAGFIPRSASWGVFPAQWDPKLGIHVT